MKKGQKVSILINDEWITGTFVKEIQAHGQDWLIIKSKDRTHKINAGFVEEIFTQSKAKIIPFPKLAK